MPPEMILKPKKGKGIASSNTTKTEGGHTPVTQNIVPQFPQFIISPSGVQLPLLKTQNSTTQSISVDSSPTSSTEGTSSHELPVIQKDYHSFETTKLQVCKNPVAKFKAHSYLDLNDQDQCFLANLWHLQTHPNATNFKVQVLNALSIYFFENNKKSKTQKQKNQL